LPGIDEKLTRELHRLGESGALGDGWDPEQAFERIADRKTRRRTIRRMEAASLVVVVLLATMAGSYGLWKILGVGRATRPHPATSVEGPIKGKIAFVRFDLADNTRSLATVYTVNPDGGGLAKLSGNDEAIVDLAWSPDGTRLAFAAAQGSTAASKANPQIYVMDGDGSDRTQLTHDASAQNMAPAWSPDGTRIAFSKLAGDVDSSGLYVIGSDGEGISRLTDGPIDSSPAWFPDGSRILFVRSPEGVSELHVVDADGSDEHAVGGPGSGYVDSVTLSPDGTRIAFARLEPDLRQKNFEVFVANADGTGEIRLTRTPAPEADPSWSPDGSRIVFAREGDINTMAADGSDVRRVTDSGSDGWPAWQRTPSAENEPVPSPEPSPTATSTSAVRCAGYQVTADFDGNGRGDQAISNSSPPEAGANCPGSGERHEDLALTVLLSGGGGRGTHVIDRCDGLYCGSLREADLNGDGKFEIAFEIAETAGSRTYEIFGMEEGLLHSFGVVGPGTEGYPGSEPLRLTEGFTTTHGDFLRCAPAGSGSGLVITLSADLDRGSSGAPWTIHETTFRFDGHGFTVSEVRDYAAKATPPDGLPELPGDDCFAP
jgi:Tol biopolymer transport system component